MRRRVSAALGRLRRFLVRRDVRRGALAVLITLTAVVVGLVVRPRAGAGAPGPFAHANDHLERRLVLAEVRARMALVLSDLAAGRDGSDVLRLLGVVVNELEGPRIGEAYAGSSELSDQIQTLQLQIGDGDPHAEDTVRSIQATLRSLR